MKETTLICKLKNYLSDFRTIFFVWLVMAIVPWLRIWLKGKFDLDYSIFYHSFWHAWQQMPLYIIYPEDGNYFLYGPLFPLLIAPLAVLPYQLGRLIWMLIITFVPYWSIRQSFFTRRQQLFILWFVAVEAYTCILDSESNSIILACILFTFYLTEKEHDCWAAFLIALGTVTKIYGIVGLAFLPFSRHKLKFLGWFVAWMIVLSILPMLAFGFDYVCGQYHAWYDVLVHKNDLNQFAAGQNISLLGIVRKVSGIASYSDLWLIIPGMIAFGLPYLRFSQYKHQAFRFAILASVLMFVVLFSTGSESYGYIIAMPGVAIWYLTAPWKRSRIDLALIVLAFIITSMSPSDLFPRVVWRELIKPYSLKALPVAIIWFKLTYELLSRHYSCLQNNQVASSPH
ncbi:MAG: DUF2029 domain-containing protein [Prevotella sp.]|nr:DUF2029 domain-containing protein [Prevotella sp.]MBR1557009.1 DUF2029 domain-containing protein [Prevotella sp.]